MAFWKLFDYFWVKIMIHMISTGVLQHKATRKETDIIILVNISWLMFCLLLRQSVKLRHNYILNFFQSLQLRHFWKLLDYIRVKIMIHTGVTQHKATTKETDTIIPVNISRFICHRLKKSLNSSISPVITHSKPPICNRIKHIWRFSMMWPVLAFLWPFGPLMNF